MPQSFSTYQWHTPTVYMTEVVRRMSRTLKLHHDLVRDAIADEVFNVIGDANAYTKTYPPITVNHKFNAGVVDREWLNGTGLFEPFSEFVEVLRDDIELLRKQVQGSLGLFTDRAHIRRCSATGLYIFPIVGEGHVQDVRPWAGLLDKTDSELVSAGCVLSQGCAMVLPELASRLLLAPWQCDEDIFVHTLPREIHRYIRAA